jgi:hypothetical protein
MRFMGPLLIALLLGGCSTQIPPLIESRAPSYDGRDLNSGVVALVPGGQIVTAHWRDRYNAMIALYGNRFMPPLQTDAGVSPAPARGHSPAPAADGSLPQYFIDNEHAVKFDLMNEWRKAAPPASPVKAAKPSTPSAVPAP